jgi:hypothetical protein
MPTQTARSRIALELLLEFVVIIMGVLVALAANEWRESRADDTLVATVLTAVRAEVAANREELGRAIALREQQIEDVRNGEGVSLQAGFLRDAAWGTAQATGAAALLDFRVASALSEIHESHLDYQRTVDSARELIYFAEVLGPLFLENPSPEDFRGFTSVLSDMLEQERGLLALYEQLGELVGP